MCPRMRLQQSSRSKFLRTNVARIGPFAGMRPHMNRQRATLRELLLALPATVRLLPRMDAHVCLQQLLLVEPLAARVANERLFAAVQHLVVVQARKRRD